MGLPMMPSPMTATVVIVAQPGRAPSMVLMRTPGPPSRRTGGLEPADVAVEVRLASTWLMPTGRVGDLHMRDAVGVAGDRSIEVVAVDGQVVEVAQQAEVAHPVSCATRSITPTTSAAARNG